MRYLNYETDLCIVGGGIAGLCCALAASRHGIKTVLMQDRHVLGGNASSEIRMWISGAHGKDNKETGIVEELMLENYYSNPKLKFPLWDSVLYSKAKAEENLTLLLNTVCLHAECEGEHIKSVKGYQSNAETYHTVNAKYFADCSGDSILAQLTGAAYMYGRESKSEFGESIPPEVADKKTMGMSCLLQLRETPEKTEFTPPDWAYVYETDDDLPFKDHDLENNFWWIEVGGEWDGLHDTDKCRDELVKIAYGVWDHIKNRGDHGADNWELEWIGFLPGKRESRRYVGKYVITENDVNAEGRHFPDIIAYGGWTMDDHFPEGFYYREGYPTIFHPAPSPWGIPLRSLVARDIDNLVFAGRNISVTHAALSSSRVMGTCALLGQALGTAVAMAVKENKSVLEVDISTLQAALMEDDCRIPWHKRELSPLTLNAKCNAEIVRNGEDRGEENIWCGKEGDFIEYTFDKPELVSSVRIIFDSNLNRGYLNMACRYPLKEQRVKMPDTMMREYDLIGVAEDGELFKIEVKNNRSRLARHNVDKVLRSIRLVPKKTYGHKDFRVFSFEVR